MCDNEKRIKSLDISSLIKVFDEPEEVILLADRPALLSWLAVHDPLVVVALDDPVVEASGHDPRSAYTETYWTPCLGPTATMLLRRLAGWLERLPDGFPLPLGPLARELGLGDTTGRNSPVVRSLARLVEFSMAQVRGETLAVRRAVPTLARRHEHRLPGHLADRHRAELEPAAVQAFGSRDTPVVIAGARFGGSAERLPGAARGRSRTGPPPFPTSSPDGRSAA